MIPATGDKLLIDTGSSKTIICPKFAQKHYPNSIYQYNFEITTSHGTTKHNSVADLPIQNLFNEQGVHTCYLFNFHDEYVGLIGSDLLSNLPASINYKWMHIQTENTTVPFYYNPSQIKQEIQKRNECNFSKLKPTQNLLKSINIPPRTELFVTLPAVGNNGSKLAPKLNFNQNVIMPSAIVKLHNNWFKTSLINTSNEIQNINIYNPLFLDEYETDTNQPIQINNINPVTQTLKIF